MGSISSIAQWPALWGACGAIIYAAPRLTVCLFAARSDGKRWFECGCVFEFIVALLIGTIAALAFGPWIGASILKATDPGQLRAIATGIGLLANPAAPRVIEILNGRIFQMIKGPGADT